ncbi:ROK family protein [Nonomuraea aurantiaca]|uniref:ROK family protein n=1 Tax=Nonomuraea aurantiaca TaxID=2878562 RepID=UPI001CD931C1|nr:ROK family protein [Nonomuraea aurantiaca]MCA2220579.1 ROK family protein [Nonomuraea aurantiaca]
MAVDVGGTTLKGGLVGRDGTPLYVERRATPRADGPGQVIAAISAFVTDLSRARSSGGGVLEPVAVGLAVPGLVTATHAVFSAAIGWRDVPVEAFTEVDLPVALGHDVRSAGEAELAYGGGSGDVLYLPIGTGIAGAVVLSGSLYGGAAGWAGQIGHIPVRPDGVLCACGQRGCLAAYASASAIAARCGASSAADVVARVRTADAQAVAVWNEAVEALSLALATYTLLLDPALVVIGGGLSLAGDTLIAPLRDRLASLLTFRRPPALRVSALGVHAGLLGAGLLGWRAQETHWQPISR